MSTAVLRLGYGTSRGRDTYGYAIVRLVDETAGRTFRCMGGGYDMVGTVLADWAVSTHQDRLRKLADKAHATVRPGEGYRTHDKTPGIPDGTRFYGMCAYYDETGQLARVSIDGACGQSSVERILVAAGVRITRTFVASGRNRGNTTGWLADVDETGGAS